MRFTKKLLFSTSLLLYLFTPNASAQGGPWVVFDECFKTVYEIAYAQIDLSQIVAHCVEEAHKVVTLPEGGSRKLSCGCRVITAERKAVEYPGNKK